MIQLYLNISFAYVCRVVRHRTAADGPFDVTDKFRIDIFVDKRLIGRKQILSSLQKDKPSSDVGFHSQYDNNIIHPPTLCLSPSLPPPPPMPFFQLYF